MVTKTAMPAHPDDVHCDTCPETYPFRGSEYLTRDLARSAGWHIYPGVRVQALCPACIGTPRSRLPKVQNFDGQADILEVFGIDPLSLEQRERRGD